MTYLAKLRRYPPVLVRLLARSPGEDRALTDIEIEKRSDGRLSLGLIRWLSTLTCWDEVTVGDHLLFCRACNVDLMDTARLRTLNRYLKDPRFRHLRRDGQWPMFRELMRIYAKSLCKN